MRCAVTLPLISPAIAMAPKLSKKEEKHKNLTHMFFHFFTSNL